MRPIPLLVSSAFLATALFAQANPYVLSTTAPIYQSGSPLTLTIAGPPGTAGVLLIDIDPGPTTIPGIGTFQIGFTPFLVALAIPPLSASGEITLCDASLCPPPGQQEVRFYVQAASATFSPPSFAVSNPVTLIFQDPAGYCEEGVCAGDGAIGSNFNGTGIDGGKWLWFNAVGKISNLDGAPATVRMRNAKIEFAAGGVNYSLDVPDTVIIVTPLVTQPNTFFDWSTGEWHVTVPVGHTGNVFLGGLAFHVPAAGLPGGINPVDWTVHGTSNVFNAEVQWKWAAAVYGDFTDRYNALDVTPVDNGDHAGTPRAYKTFVVGGARGGGGSNFTGSYSATKTFRCQ